MGSRQSFDKSLSELKEQTLQLGSMVKDRIYHSVESLKTQDLELANQIITGDLEINELQSAIEDKCIHLIATQQPLAKDLRKIVAALKIGIYLERMGDLSVDIAKVTVRLGESKQIKPLIDIPRMADLVVDMINKGLTASMDENVEAAREMALLDDQVDHLYAQIFRELLIFMMEDPKIINQSTYLIFAARFLERMGDYCTNIAEEVEYIVRGKRSDLNM
ncbi:MAG: phosphate signaling complex protein PhoU [Desulfitobacterium hafniense]|nr:phosphate signaling complex protein PhoU [Desulfitobacterium hafniense]